MNLTELIAALQEIAADLPPDLDLRVTEWNYDGEADLVPLYGIDVSDLGVVTLNP